MTDDFDNENETFEEQLNLLPSPPPLIDPYAKEVYIQKKSTNHKDWREPVLAHWDERLKTLRDGTGKYEPREWMRQIMHRVADMHNIHIADITFRFKRKDDAGRLKNKPALRVEKYSYGCINPLYDNLFIMITDHCSHRDCPVNSGDKKKKTETKKKKKSKNKNKKKRSRHYSSSESDSDQAPAKKRRRKDKEEDSNDSDGSDYDSDKKNDKKSKGVESDDECSKAMFAQTMELIIKQHNKTLTGDGLVAFCELICANPNKYDYLIIPDKLNKYRINNNGVQTGGYTTNTTHSNTNTKPAQPQSEIQQQHPIQQQPQMSDFSKMMEFAKIFQQFKPQSYPYPPPPPPQTAPQYYSPQAYSYSRPEHAPPPGPARTHQSGLAHVHQSVPARAHAHVHGQYYNTEPPPPYSPSIPSMILTSPSSTHITLETQEQGIIPLTLENNIDDTTSLNLTVPN